MSVQNCPAHRGAFFHLRACTWALHEEDVMSNANPPFQNFSFDPLAITAANEAYDLACKTLQNIGQLEVDREIIARGILRAAMTGERDANKLCERAILGLTAFDYRQDAA
jgi:hypothetical protein